MNATTKPLFPPIGSRFLCLLILLLALGTGGIFLAGCTRATAASGKARIPMSAHMKRFTYRGLNINYVERGSGPDILLIHGFGASTYSWEPIIDAYSGRFHTLAIDLKGFGLSDKPADSDYSAQAQSDLIKAFIQEKGLKKVVLVGHSFGGAVALITCLDLMGTGNPVDRLILIDSAGYEQSFPFFIAALRIPILDRISLAMLSDRAKARMVLKAAFFDPAKITEEKVDIYASFMKHEGSSHALIATSKQIIPDYIASITSRYKDIKIPVLAIWGREDAIIPLQIGERLARDIPAARLEVIDRCGHVPQEECPGQVIPLFEAFLPAAP